MKLYPHSPPILLTNGFEFLTYFDNNTLYSLFHKPPQNEHFSLSPFIDKLNDILTSLRKISIVNINTLWYPQFSNKEEEHPLFATSSFKNE